MTKLVNILTNAVVVTMALVSLLFLPSWLTFRYGPPGWFSTLNIDTGLMLYSVALVLVLSARVAKVGNRYVTFAATTLFIGLIVALLMARVFRP